MALGRKKVTPNKATTERQARVAASGPRPLDYLLKIMRNKNLETAVRLDGGQGGSARPNQTAIRATSAPFLAAG